MYIQKQKLLYKANNTKENIMQHWDEHNKWRQEEIDKLNENDPEYETKWIELQKRIDPFFGYED